MNRLNVLNEWGLTQAPATTPPSPLVDSLVGSGLGVVAGSALGAFLSHAAIGAVAGGLFGAAAGCYYSTLNAVPPPPAPPPPTAPVTAGVTPPAAPSCTTLKPGVMPVVTVSTSNPATYQYCLPTGATLVLAAPANVGQGQESTDINVDSSPLAGRRRQIASFPRGRRALPATRPPSSRGPTQTASPLDQHHPCQRRELKRSR